MKTINIKGKEYVEVNERVKYFRKNYPEWSLVTEIIKLENGFCLMKATVIDEHDNVRSTGHSYENENSTFINKTSYIENCETSAIGRALGNLGIGIDVSIASAEEVKTAILNQDKTKEIADDLAKDNVENIDEYLKDIKSINDVTALREYYKANIKLIKANDTLDTAFQARAKELKETV